MKRSDPAICDIAKSFKHTFWLAKFIWEQKETKKLKLFLRLSVVNAHQFTPPAVFTLTVHTQQWLYYMNNCTETKHGLLEGVWETEIHVVKV